MPPTETSPYRLLVEGPDDLHSVTQLLVRHGYDWDDRSERRPFIKSEEGIEKLLEALPVVLKGSYDRIRRIHTWLAWQKEPGQPFGIALRSKIFQHDTEEALRFVAWFRRLFVDP